MHQLTALIHEGAREREIQAALKADLSVIAQTCVHSAIQDEYIAFSEFPLGTGFVDFVVFTDRSRMDVVLFEIKGADFEFLNADGSVAKLIDRAAEQMRNRFDEIERNYESFRREAHALRKTIEAGQKKFNSILGPNGYLHVDPEKDIDVWGIVIGGRTREDYAESRARYKLEKYTNRVRFESWDSWLRKYGGVQCQPPNPAIHRTCARIRAGR